MFVASSLASLFTKGYAALDAPILSYVIRPTTYDPEDGFQGNDVRGALSVGDFLYKDNYMGNVDQVPYGE